MAARRSIATRAGGRPPTGLPWGMVRVVSTCLLAMAVGAAHAEPIALRDDRGVLLKLAAPPRRIVSLLPSATETLCALGGCARLVGTDRFSNWPAGVRSLPKLGGLEDAQIERIVALRPDVVLVSSAARLTDRLEGLGLQVLVLDSNDRADMRRSLDTIARLLGTPTLAATLWSRIEQQTLAAAARVPAALRGRRVYFEVDPTPFAAGPRSFIGETLASLGLANVVPAAMGPFPQLNPEYVVRLQPDIVMASDRNLAEMPRRPGWQALKALHAGRVCGFPAGRYDLLVRPGPRMGEAAGLIADCLASIADRAAPVGAPR